MERSKPHAFRTDIQGLRAVALALVVGDHLLGWPRGGFVGVDIFFVISGFLITGLLLREGDRSGRISIANFYRRRARRILPVSLVVLGATVTAAYVLFLASRFEDVVSDAWWTLAFSVNWRLASTGTDYFQSDLPPSPLQHYWSLAVEEQFYLVWPILVGALLLAATRVKPRTSVAGFAAVVIGASFGWAMWESVNQPTVAYFSTFSRAWELAAGALLAASAAVLTRLNMLVRNIIGITGLLGIGASVFLIDQNSQFPAPIGALPVASTCLVIAAGIGVQSVRCNWVLTVRPMVYGGAISYSLYLWHWPVIVFLESLMAPTVTFYVTAAAVMLGMSVLSYHLVEKPVLNSSFLAPVHRGARTRPSDDDSQKVLVGALGVVLVLLFVATFNQPTVTPTHSGPAPVLASAATLGNVDPLEAAIREALRADRFPALTPPLDNIEIGMPEEMKPAQNCLDPESISLDLCNYGDPAAPRTAFVVGDSVSMSWMPTVRGALEPAGYRVHGVALANCPFIGADIEIDEDKDHSARCNSSNSDIAEQILSARPDLVIMSDMEYGIRRLVTDPGSPRAWTDARASMIERIKPSGARIVVVAPDPFGKAATDCATRLSTPSDCISDISDNWAAKRDADEAAAKRTGVEFVDTRSWFCYRGSCPIFVSGILVRWDTGHITQDYGRYLVPKMAELLVPA